MSDDKNRRDMDEEQKIEKLRQRADVSYEEARDALRACEGDLLDAMVYLERLGQAKAPEQTTFSTNAEEKQSYENVTEAVSRSQDENSDPSFGEQLGHLLKTAFQKSIDNSLVVSHRGEEKFRLPILVVVLLFLVFNFAAVVALIVSLFFDVKYQFAGKDDLSKVNRMMDEAGSKASTWMHDSYRNENERQAARQERREADQAAREARREEDRRAREERAEADRRAREVRREEDRRARDERAEADRKAREDRREEDRRAREERAEADRRAREERREANRDAAESDKAARKAQEAADKAARKAQEAADKAARLAQEAADKAARLAQNAADRVANAADRSREEDIDTSIRHETFAEKEVKDLKKKYDESDKDDSDNK